MIREPQGSFLVGNRPMERWQLLTTIIVAIFGSTGFWSWLSQRHASNKEILNRVDGLAKKVDDLSYKVDCNEAVECRARVLRFNKELIENERHTEEEFTQALEDCDKYEKFCSKHPDFRNNKASLSIENIKRCYLKCEEQHDFL